MGILDWIGDGLSYVGSGISDLYDNSWLESGVNYVTGSDEGELLPLGKGSSYFSDSPEVPSYSSSIGSDLKISAEDLYNNDIVPGSNSGGGGFLSNLWDDAKKELGTYQGIGSLIKGGYAAYTAAAAANDKKDRDKQLLKEHAEDRELARLKMLLDIEQSKYAMKMKNAGGSGGGSASHQIAMINALNNAAQVRINALNNFSAAFTAASKGGRYG